MRPKERQQHLRRLIRRATAANDPRLARIFARALEDLEPLEPEGGAGGAGEGEAKAA